MGDGGMAVREREVAAARSRRDGARRRQRTRADELAERWRAGAAALWSPAGGWWSPAVETLVRAIADGRDPVAQAARLGGDRAAARASLGCTLDDLNVLLRLPRVWCCRERVVRAVVRGWTARAASAADAAILVAS